MGPNLGDPNTLLGEHVRVTNGPNYPVICTAVTVYQDATPCLLLEWTEPSGAYHREWFDAGRCELTDVSEHWPTT